MGTKVGQSVCQSASPSGRQAVCMCFNQSVRQAGKQAGRQSVRVSGSQSGSQSVSQSVKQAGRQSVCVSVSQRVSQSVSQSVNLVPRGPFCHALEIGTPGQVQRHSRLCKHNRLRPEPIRFVRLDSGYAQSDRKSVNRRLPVLDLARGRDPSRWQKDRGLWEWDCQSVRQTGRQSVCLSVSHLVCQSVSQSVSQSAGRVNLSWSVNLWVNSVCQSVSWTVSQNSYWLLSIRRCQTVMSP